MNNATLDVDVDDEDDAAATARAADIVVDARWPGDANVIAAVGRLVY